MFNAKNGSLLFSAAEINAARVPARDRKLVILPSAAIERLDSADRAGRRCA